MKRTLTLLTLLVFGAGMLAYAQELTTHHVNDNIYMIEGDGGNIGVSVGDDGILIIDDKFARLSDAIRAEVAKLDDGKLEFILNTHHHGDHTGANEKLGGEAHIIAHANVRKRLAEGKNIDDETVRNGIPVITFDESLSLHFNGEEIKAVHAPTGHTDGDSIIFFTKANVVHMGDQFFLGRFPYVDLDGGGDVAGYLKNVKEMLRVLPSDVRIIPGHGPLGTVEDLKEFARTIDETTAIIRKQIDDGKSIEEIQKAGLPDKYAPLGAGFISVERWIEIVHTSFTR
jgi:glyoxylase-like metal-dependent hydrolase (beta-lactamase superfamily II)